MRLLRTESLFQRSVWWIRRKKSRAGSPVYQPWLMACAL